ncbi:MAG: hypothetical protein Q7R59_01205 [bacterium]|nr:hypothetical protein [bacterium]
MSWLKRIINKISVLLRIFPKEKSLPVEIASTRSLLPEEIQPPSSSSSETFTISKDEFNQFQKIIKDAKDAVSSLEDIKDNAKRAVEKAEKIEYLVYFGFVILVVMVAGIFLDQARFVFEGRATYEGAFLDRLRVQETETTILRQDLGSFRKCLYAGGWSACFAQ